MKTKRFGQFNHDIIIIDGVYGSGKSLISNIIGSLSGVEKQQYDIVVEQLCILNWLNKIDKEACEQILLYRTDQLQYESLIGREINLKISEVTSIFNNPKALEYLKRIFLKNNNGENNINKDLALQLFTHNMISISSPLISALEDRLKFIEIVRHPLYLIQHFSNAMKRLYLETNSQFEYCLDVNGSKIPWFAKEYSKEFLSANDVEKSIISIINLYSEIEKISKSNNSFLVLSFESFITSPMSNVKKLCDFLGRDEPLNIEKILRKQNIPRKTIKQSKGNFQYGWSNHKNKTEKEMYDDNWKFIVKNCSPEYCEKFNNLIKWYDKSFPSELSNLK